MSVNRVYQFLKILSKLEDNELDMTYRVLLAFADSRGIRMDAKEKVNFDRERREAETAEAAPKKSGNTRLPYALCKQAGIDTTGFTPSECWAALQGEGVSAKEAYKDLKEEGKVTETTGKVEEGEESENSEISSEPGIEQSGAEQEQNVGQEIGQEETEQIPPETNPVENNTNEQAENAENEVASENETTSETESEQNNSNIENNANQLKPPKGCKELNVEDIDNFTLSNSMLREEMIMDGDVIHCRTQGVDLQKVPHGYSVFKNGEEVAHFEDSGAAVSLMQNDKAGSVGVGGIKEITPDVFPYPDLDLCDGVVTLAALNDVPVKTSTNITLEPAIENGKLGYKYGESFISHKMVGLALYNGKSGFAKKIGTEEAKKLAEDVNGGFEYISAGSEIDVNGTSYLCGGHSLFYSKEGKCKTSEELAADIIWSGGLSDAASFDMVENGNIKTAPIGATMSLMGEEYTCVKKQPITGVALWKSSSGDVLDNGELITKYSGKKEQWKETKVKDLSTDFNKENCENVLGLMNKNEILKVTSSDKGHFYVKKLNENEYVVHWPEKCTAAKKNKTQMAKLVASNAKGDVSCSTYKAATPFQIKKELKDNISNGFDEAKAVTTLDKMKNDKSFTVGDMKYIKLSDNKFMNDEYGNIMTADEVAKEIKETGISAGANVAVEGVPIHGEGNKFSEDCFTQDRKNKAVWADTDEKFDKLENKLIEETKTSLKNLPKVCKIVAISYTDGSGDFNKNLRMSYLRGEEPKIGENIKYLDELLNSTTTTEDMWINRGVHVTSLDFLCGGALGVAPDYDGGDGGKVYKKAAFAKLSKMTDEEITEAIMSCEELYDPAYTSCSPREGGGFAEKDNDCGVIANIYCPKGTKGAYLNDFSVYGDEQEYLLARGAHFEPTKVEIERDSSGTIINMFVDFDLIAQD